MTIKNTTIMQKDEKKKKQSHLLNQSIKKIPLTTNTHLTTSRLVKPKLAPLQK